MIQKPGIFASKSEWAAYNKQQQDIQTNAANAVSSNAAAAQAAIGQSTAASQQAFNAAQAAQAANQGQVSLINTDAEALRRQAGTVSGIAQGMATDTSALRGDAATLRSSAANLWGQGQNWFGIGSDIVNLNPNATGIGGEWSRYYSSLSPDSLVSFAASDAQRSIENTRGQLARTLSGMGVSPGSAAYGAALAKARQYETALLAGVKTRARMLGIEKQGDALAQGMQMAISATGLGQNLANAAVGATQAAVGAQGQAANVEQARGGLEVQAGQLTQGAGNLAATAAQVGTAGVNALTNAANSLANAQQTAADYYSTQSSSILGLLQSGNSVALGSLFS